MFVVAVITPVASAGVMLAAYLFLPLPADLPERALPPPSQMSRVYDAAGNEIGVFKRFETSIPVAPEDIPEVLEQAVVAAEDRSFYSHGGVDVRGTLRALWADIRNRELGQGGRSEEHTSELQSLMRTSSAVFCLQTIQYAYQQHKIVQ